MTPPPDDTDSLTRERDNLKRILSSINSRYLEKIEELSLIRRIGDALKDITDYRTVCCSIVSIIQQELDPDNCALMMIDSTDGRLHLQAAKGPYDDEARFYAPSETATACGIGQDVAEAVARTGTSIIIPDVTCDQRFEPVVDDQSIRALMSVPLIAGERVTGVLNLSHATAGIFNEEKERILAIIANSSATALENTRLYQQLRQARDTLAAENISLRKELGERYAPDHIIGTSPCFTAILATVEKVAAVDVNVLVTGESGTGKELIARTLHYNSPRADAPLVSVNCAALPDTLLESELFGIEKGVATGVEQRRGKFEQASGGSLFLDEIGDMALATQAKILRVLQERNLQRVGGSTTIPIDVRVIAATNRDLETMIRDGQFREDLYYRLKVVAIDVPPLRQRREDIPLLANHFLRLACERHRLGEKWFSRHAMQLLGNAVWKGNVRELQNMVEQAAILSNGEIIGAQDLPLDNAGSAGDLRVVIPPGRVDYRPAMREIQGQAEAGLIRNALEQTGGNKSRAADLLGISRRTLLYRLRDLPGLQDDQ